MTKSIIITGAGSGIGRATAATFLEAGWQVGLIGRRAETLEQTAADHENALVLACDVGDPAAVEGAFAIAKNKWGRLDALFNNAGIGSPAKTIDETDVDVWLDVVRINLTGSFLCARAAFAIMRNQSPQGGRIINIGSEVVHLGITPFTAYVAAKGGQNGFNRSLAHELAPWNITVNMVAPGWIPVERHENDPQDLKDGYFASIPMQRWGKPEDLAGTIVYLASEASSFVTGQNIHVNGGVTVH